MGLTSPKSTGSQMHVEQGDPIWQTPEMRMRLDSVWNSVAPVELRHTVELLSDLADDDRFYLNVWRIGIRASAATLKWALEQLDEDWQQRAGEGLRLLSQHPEYRRHISGEILQTVEQETWHAILQVWPHLSLWRGLSLAADPALARGLRYLGLENNPFGSGQAETDTLLLTCRVDPPWLEELRRPRPALLTGITGSGRTATALLLAYDSLQTVDAFPVYCPITSGTLDLNGIAQVLAHTLLRYLAVAPAGFIKCAVAGKAATAHLLARYTCPHLALRFHQAGLPLTGDGAKMLQEIEALTGNGSFQEPLTDNELLALLSEARPHNFTYAAVLLDVQEQTGEIKNASNGYHVMFSGQNHAEKVDSAFG